MPGASRQPFISYETKEVSYQSMLGRIIPICQQLFISALTIESVIPPPPFSFVLNVAYCLSRSGLFKAH